MKLGDEVTVHMNATSGAIAPKRLKANGLMALRVLQSVRAFAVM